MNKRTVAKETKKLETFLRAHSAIKKDGDNFVFGNEWIIPTKAGELTFHLDLADQLPSIFCRFKDVETAAKYFDIKPYAVDDKGRNLYPNGTGRFNACSGKYNFHYADVETVVFQFIYELTPLTLTPTKV